MKLNWTRYAARWVLPVATAPIRHGAVLVDPSGRIAEVGPADRVTGPAETWPVELGEAALLPGLVNTHAHPELTAFRGLLEDRPFERWITELVGIKSRAQLTSQDWQLAAAWACAESIAGGMTTLAATEDSGAALAALLESGMRGIVYREVFGPAPATARAAIAGLAAKVEHMRTRETELVRVGISPHAPYTVSDELYRGAAELARAEALPVAVHAAEAEVEERLVSAGTGVFAAGLQARGIATPPRARSTIALLHQTGILATRPLAIHCVRVNTEDIAMLADSGTTVAHCPIANARLGHGTAPVPELLEAGVPVGLGTDSVASNNRLDLLEEARMAQLVQRLRTGSGEVMPAQRLLRLATLDGARALGLESRIGSLETGKDADLCAVALDRLHTTPAHDPAAVLVHSARASDVVLTVVRGRILFRAGRFQTLDVEALRQGMERVAGVLRAAVAPA